MRHRGSFATLVSPRDEVDRVAPLRLTYLSLAPDERREKGLPEDLSPPESRNVRAPREVRRMRSVEPSKGTVNSPAPSLKRPSTGPRGTRRRGSEVRAVEPSPRDVVNYGLRWVAGLENGEPPPRVVYVEHDERRWELHVFLGQLPDIPVPGPEDNPWLKEVLKRRAERRAHPE